MLRMNIKQSCQRERCSCSFRSNLVYIGPTLARQWYDPFIPSDVASIGFTPTEVAWTNDAIVLHKNFDYVIFNSSQLTTQKNITNCGNNNDKNKKETAWTGYARNTSKITGRLNSLN
jgi:hypothetical protein